MNTRSKSSLFLIELVIVILVFSLSAAVCLRLFFQSRQISDQSRNISEASLAVQSVADIYKGSNGDFNKTADFLKGTIADDTISFYYDSVWERVEQKGDASFVVELEKTKEEHRECVITASTLKDNSSIFSVTVRGGLDLD